MRQVISCAIVASIAGLAGAQEFDVVGGQTSVLLDTDTLAAAASLTLSGVSDDVIAPGEIDGSVAFGINARNGNLPTTFSYDAGLASFGGAIEHSGSVFFNDGSVEVGDFTIGFDAGRVGDGRSGFFVESTAGIAAILFDVEDPTGLVADGSGLQITADLLVSAEFGQFLFDNGLSSSNLAGADVGDAFVNAIIPAPGAMGAFALAGLAATRRRR